MPSASDPIIDLLPAPTRPTLPTELIEEILEQPSLSKLDLAQCCLVSRQFINPARRSLYSTITIDWKGEGQPSRPKFVPTKRSLLLVETLQTSTTLGNLVISLSCEASSQYAVPGRRRRLAADVPQLAEDLLESLPRLTKLYLRNDAFEPLQEYTRSHGSRWTHLYLTSVDACRDFVADSPLSNLRRLECENIVVDDAGDQQVFLPPQLTHLDCVSIDALRFSIANASSSPLQFLRLSSIDLIDFPDFSKLPQLHHLEVKGYDPTDDQIRRLAESISRFPSLTSLTFDDVWTYDEETYFELLKALPVSLTQFNIPSYATLGPVIDLIDGGLHKSIRTLGLSDGDFQEEGERVQLEELQSSCERKGIDIVYLLDSSSFFDM